MHCVADQLNRTHPNCTALHCTAPPRYCNYYYQYKAKPSLASRGDPPPQSPPHQIRLPPSPSNPTCHSSGQSIIFPKTLNLLVLSIPTASYAQRNISEIVLPFICLAFQITRVDGLNLSTTGSFGWVEDREGSGICPYTIATTSRYDALTTAHQTHCTSLHSQNRLLHSTLIGSTVILEYI